MTTGISGMPLLVTRNCGFGGERDEGSGHLVRVRCSLVVLSTGLQQRAVRRDPGGAGRAFPSPGAGSRCRDPRVQTAIVLTGQRTGT